MIFRPFAPGDAVRANNRYPQLRHGKPRTRGVVKTIGGPIVSVQWDGLTGREYVHQDFLERLVPGEDQKR
jgi:hypothetical protein